MCDCTVEDIQVGGGRADYRIKYCSLHEAAPQMLTLLGGAWGYLQSLPEQCRPDKDWVEPIRKLLIEQNECICLPGSPNDECPDHGIEAFERRRTTDEVKQAQDEEREQLIRGEEQLEGQLG